LNRPEFQYFTSQVKNLFEDQDGFEKLALEIFRFQALHNPTYKEFIEHLNVDIESVISIHQIPFLPISFFKSREIRTFDWKEEAYFLSSGTTGQIRSRHSILDLDFYHENAVRIFEHQIGNLSQFQIIGLLPTYLENPNSSLISMVLAFGKKTRSKVAFCGLDFEFFHILLKKARAKSKRILLFSVTYALLKLIEEKPTNLSDCLVIETGGMKGLGTNISKPEIITLFNTHLHIENLYSEYGMTELLSQAYAQPLNFRCNPIMKILVRDTDDPFSVSSFGRGCANIIDLANFSTCSFIASDDLCQVQPSGSFEILGRLEGSDLRGCNLLFA